MKKDKKLFWFLLGFAVSIIFFLMACYHLETDYFWHVKAGEYMVHHGPLTHDVFSWYTMGKYWMSHEWLFDILIYGFKVLFGNLNVLVYCFLCISFLTLLLFFVNRKNFQKNVSYSLIFFTFFGTLLAFYIQARPHMISLCLLALTSWFLIDLYKNPDSKKIYFLPLISIIWSNVHGGSSNLPYLLCFLFLLGGVFSFQFKKIEAKKFSKRQLKKYLIVMFLCMGAVCVNIHGFKMFIYPYQNMLDKTMLDNISEWQVTSLSEWTHFVYYSFLLFLVFTFLFSNRKIQFMDLLLAGFITFLGLKSIRFWNFGPIVMSFILFDYVEERNIDPGTYGGILILALFFFGVFVISIPRITKSHEYLNLNSSIISVLKNEKPKRLFNMYDYGGELIYHDIPVFVDGRADLYSSYNFKDYLTISKFESGCIYFMKKYDFDYYLLSNNYPVYNYLEDNDNYQLIYSYNNIYLFKKVVNEK